jgi:hypothetical protein
MGYEMRQLRKEDLSLYYYIKHIALLDFIEHEEMAVLNRLELHESCEDNVRIYEAITEWCGVDDVTPNPTERGRGWVYLDCTTISGTNKCSPYTLVSGTDTIGEAISGITEQSNRINVYDVNLQKIPDTDYMVDYLDGRIIVAGAGVSTPVYVDYDWYYVSVVDEWAAIEAANPPVVVIDMHGTDKVGYQIGPGKKATRKVDLHIFSSNPAERNDIGETLYDSLYNSGCPIYNFPDGTMLEYDGTWYGRKNTTDKLSSLFNPTTSTAIIGNIIFDNVTSRNISLPLVMTRDRSEVMLSDLNAYRSKISFDLISYTRT